MACVIELRLGGRFHPEKEYYAIVGDTHLNVSSSDVDNGEPFRIVYATYFAGGEKIAIPLGYLANQVTSSEGRRFRQISQPSDKTGLEHSIAEELKKETYSDLVIFDSYYDRNHELRLML